MYEFIVNICLVLSFQQLLIIFYYELHCQMERVEIVDWILIRRDVINDYYYFSLF